MVQLQHENATLRSKAEVLEDELRLLKHRLFGRRSEQLSEEDRRQASLFDEAEWIESEHPCGSTEGVAVTVRAHLRRPRGRKPLPADLPREEVLHDIPEEEKVCRCGAALVRIGEETREQLEVIPQQVKVIRHIRPQYACRPCDGVEGEPMVKIAPTPPPLIPKSIAAPGLLAYVLVSKFCDALPFYRQEKLLRPHRGGALAGRFLPLRRWRPPEPATRSSSGCSRRSARGRWCEMDETRLQVMKELGRANTSKSYMWVIRGGPPEHPLIVYRYHPSRSETIPLQYLAEYQGFLQTDGYDGYHKVGALPGITHAGCWAHVRRKFAEAAKASKKGGSAREALETIGRLYRIERELQDQLLTREAFLWRRKERVLPILSEFKGWLDAKALQVPPSTLLGRAVAYARSEWEKLVRYLESPYLTPDTNRVENAIRPFVLGRKNWLFSGSPRGAHASATLFSLIESAKANRLEPYRYLRYLFTKLPLVQTKEEYRALLPHHLDREEISRFCS